MKSRAVFIVRKIQELAVQTFGKQLEDLPTLESMNEDKPVSLSGYLWQGLGFREDEGFLVQSDYLEHLVYELELNSSFIEKIKSQAVCTKK